MNDPAPPDSDPSQAWWRSPPSLWWKDWAQLAANLVVVFGASFVVWQISELRADRSRDNAMQYALLLHAEPYATAALDASTALQDQAPDDDVRLAPRNIQLVGDLYLSAIRCRESGVCDAATIDANFRDTVSGFYAATRADLLPRVSCRLGKPPGDYGEPLRLYLIASHGPGDPMVPGPVVGRCG